MGLVLSLACLAWRPGGAWLATWKRYRVEGSRRVPLSLSVTGICRDRTRGRFGWFNRCIGTGLTVTATRRGLLNDVLRGISSALRLDWMLWSQLQYFDAALSTDDTGEIERVAQASCSAIAGGFRS